MGAHNIIGSSVSTSAAIQHLAAALITRAQQQDLSTIVLVPASVSSNTNDLVKKLNDVTQHLGISVGHLNHVSLIDARALVELNAGVVIVATINQSTISEMGSTWAVFEGAQKRVLGAVLAN